MENSHSTFNNKLIARVNTGGNKKWSFVDIQHSRPFGIESAISSTAWVHLSPQQGERIKVRGWSFVDTATAQSIPHPPLSLGKGEATVQHVPNQRLTISNTTLKFVVFMLSRREQNSFVASLVYVR